PPALPDAESLPNHPGECAASVDSRLRSPAYENPLRDLSTSWIHVGTMSSDFGVPVPMILGIRCFAMNS
ncbi:hypothetical protein ACFLSF_04285, partial [Candidatus Bipolaricaulota bacterium]